VPLSFPAIFDEINQQTLAGMLERGNPSAALISDEAATIIGSNGMNHENALQFFGLQNKLWDGSMYRRNRITTKDAQVVGKRLTSSLMMQPSVFHALLGIQNGQSRGTGFLARSLLSYPSSTMGTRPYNPHLNRRELDAFHARIAQVLALPLPIENKENKQLNPPVLELEDAAQSLWVTYDNQVEQELVRFGEFEDVADFAAKSSENAVRLAALFHVFEYGTSGLISTQQMKGAVAVASWHLDETCRIFTCLHEVAELQDARTVLAVRGPSILDRGAKKSRWYSGSWVLC